MEAGALFILVLILAVIVVVSAAVYAVAARLRAKKLHPEGDKIEGARAGEPGEQPRPEHLSVESDQHARSVGTR